MRKLLVIIVPILFLSSCSWITDFFVANKSDKAIELTFRYKQYGATHTCSFKQSDETLVLTAMDKLDSDSRDSWRKLQPNEYVYDNDKCEIRITLSPDHAIRVCRMGTYTGNAENRLHFFELSYLWIQRSDGRIQYEGLDLLKAFKKKSDTLYILMYR